MDNNFSPAEWLRKIQKKRRSTNQISPAQYISYLSSSYLGQYINNRWVQTGKRLCYKNQSYFSTWNMLCNFFDNIVKKSRKHQ